MAKDRTRYECAECGGKFYRWSGRCPNCGEWDSLEEAESGTSEVRSGGSAAPTFKLSELSVERGVRAATGFPELDRVLGGGVLLGSTILLGGAPGVGKSTLLLQATGRMAAQGSRCLYASCEESLPQVKIRADRLGLGDSNLSVVADGSLGALLPAMEKEDPQVVVVDSIQRVAAKGVDSAPGSLRQVRTCANALIEHAKKNGRALFLVGHVTKRGVIAGPRALEHLVDTVLYFETEDFQSLRILRATKNRFGAVNEIGVFEMGRRGLREVGNPSKLFLAERDPTVCGSVVMPAMEGSRALLVEVQALVGPGAYGTPERKVSGVDYRRFSMMLSVLERRAGLELGGSDAFVNIAGGLRVLEPAADLPLVLALASSFRDEPFLPEAVAVGEVGLGGEVRAVGRVRERLKEAEKLGFGAAVIPAGNAEDAAGFAGDLHTVRNLGEALALLRQDT